MNAAKTMVVMQEGVAPNQICFPIPIEPSGKETTPENLQQYCHLRLAVVPISHAQPHQLQAVAYRLTLAVLAGTRNQTDKEMKSYDFPNWLLELGALPAHCLESGVLTQQDAQEVVANEFIEKAKLRPIFGERSLETIDYGFLGAYPVDAKGGHAIYLVFAAAFSDILTHFQSKDDMFKYDFCIRSEVYHTWEQYSRERGRLSPIAAAVIGAGDLPTRIATMKGFRALSLLPEEFNPDLPVTFPVPIQPQGVSPTAQNLKDCWHVGVSVLLLYHTGILLVDRTEYWQALAPEDDGPSQYFDFAGDNSGLPLLSGKQTGEALLSDEEAKEWIVPTICDALRHKAEVLRPVLPHGAEALSFLGAYPCQTPREKRLTLLFGFEVPPLWHKGLVHGLYPVEYPLMGSASEHIYHFGFEDIQAWWEKSKLDTKRIQFGGVLSYVLEQGILRELAARISSAGEQRH